LAATVHRSFPVAAAWATAAALATGAASAIAAALVMAVASVIAGIGPQLFLPVVTVGIGPRPFLPAGIAATGATTRSIAAELLIVIEPPPTDSVEPLAATPWQIDRQVRGNSLAGKAAVSRAIERAAAWAIAPAADQTA
jgi:hypothetical protein